MSDNNPIQSESGPQRVDIETKRQHIAQAIQREVAAGARVESQTDTTAILVTGKKPNHVLHLILTLVTFGMWGIVWIAMAIIGGEHRVGLNVDDYGNVLRQELS